MSRQRRPRSFQVNGKLLRSLRLANNWSQEQAAAKSGYTERLIRKAEADGHLQFSSIVDFATLYSTADRLVTPDELLIPTECDRGDERESTRAEAMVRRWFDELWNQGRLDVVDELAAPNCLLHAEGREFRGREALRQRAAEVHAAFSNIVMEILNITAHDGVVSCRWRASFVQTGEWMGVSPNGQRFMVNASTWIRYENDQLTEGWDYWDVQLADIVSHDASR